MGAAPAHPASRQVTNLLLSPGSVPWSRVLPSHCSHRKAVTYEAPLSLLWPSPTHPEPPPLPPTPHQLFHLLPRMSLPRAGEHRPQHEGPITLQGGAQSTKGQTPIPLTSQGLSQRSPWGGPSGTKVTMCHPRGPSYE